MSDGAPFRPMKAVAGPLPTGPGWIHEIKWDGMRVLTEMRPGGLAAWSANGLSVTDRFPELEALHASLGHLDVVIDGEVVASDETGRPSFARLQQRIHLRGSRAEARRLEVPVSYVAFDVLRVSGRDSIDLPWQDRRRLLEQIVEPGPTWRLTTVHDGDDATVLEQADALGLEGVVAKQRGSRYRPGTRAAAWVKTKIRRRQELVVGAWTSRADTGGGVGSVMVGHHDSSGLHCAGRVGSGIGADVEAVLAERLPPLERPTSPFVGGVPRVPGRVVRHAEPVVVVEVEFGEWTPDGQLRHPVLVGVRDDVDPDQVRREDRTP